MRIDWTWLSGSIDIVEWPAEAERAPSGSGGEIYICGSIYYGDQFEDCRCDILPFEMSERRSLQCPYDAEAMLAAKFKEIGYLGSYSYLDQLVHNLAADLVCNYRFNPDYLTREDAPRLMIKLGLKIKREYCGDVDSSQPVFNPDDEQSELNFNPRLFEFACVWADRYSGNSAAPFNHSTFNQFKDVSEDQHNHKPRRLRIVSIPPATELKESYKYNCASLDCSICLGSLSEVDPMLAQTRCSHIFHRSCLYNWLLRTTDCPNCRSPLGFAL